MLEEIINKPEFLNSLLALCIEMCIFIFNIEIPNIIENIIQICHVQAFDIWKNIASFTKFDPAMPKAIKSHLKEIEIKILTRLGWTQGSSMTAVVKKIAEEN